MKRFSLNGKYEFCPNGNYWEEIPNIFSRKTHLFCDCNKCNGKVYELRAIDVTKKMSKDFINKLRSFNELEKLKDKINLDNMEKIKKIFENPELLTK